MVTMRSDGKNKKVFYQLAEFLGLPWGDETSNGGDMDSVTAQVLNDNWIF